MTAFITKSFAEMHDDAGAMVAMLNPRTVVDSMGEERPGAIKVQVRNNPLRQGWVATDMLTADQAPTAVAPTLEVPRFIEAAQDAANTVNVAFAADGVELSETLLLIFAWIDSGWENGGKTVPVPTGPQPEEKFGPFGFLPGPWAATITNPKYAEILRDITEFSRIDPYLQCNVAACFVNDLQVALRAVTGAAPSTTLIRIAYLVGAEAGRRFAQLAQGDQVDTAVDGQPALSAVTISAHQEVFASGGKARTRKEVEDTVAAQLEKAATAVREKAAEFLKPPHRPPPAPVPRADRERQAMDFFVGQGWTKAQAAGIVANLQAESGFRPDAEGDGGRAYGIAQWHPDRQAAFQRFSGRAIQGSTFEEQLSFVHHELTLGDEGRAGNRLRNANSANEAGSIVSRDYERPADREGEAARRGRAAEQILNNYR